MSDEDDEVLRKAEEEYRKGVEADRQKQLEERRKDEQQK